MPSELLTPGRSLMTHMPLMAPLLVLFMVSVLVAGCVFRMHFPSVLGAVHSAVSVSGWPPEVCL